VNSENKTLIRERLADARAALEEALPVIETDILREAIVDFLVTGRADSVTRTASLESYVSTFSR